MRLVGRDFESHLDALSSTSKKKGTRRRRHEAAAVAPQPPKPVEVSFCSRKPSSRIVVA